MIGSTLRSAGSAAGPLAVVAVALLVAAMVTAGDAEFGVETSPLALASTGTLLLAVIAMAAAATAAALRAERPGIPLAAAAAAVLLSGGSWAALFVLPALAPGAPESAFGAVTVGYVVSFLLFSVTWVAMAVGLVRAGGVAMWLGVALAVTAVLASVPAPEAFRLLPVCVVTTLLARTLRARVAVDA